jgi:hypothetical protein
MQFWDENHHAYFENILPFADRFGAEEGDDLALALSLTESILRASSQGVFLRAKSIGKGQNILKMCMMVFVPKFECICLENIAMIPC